MPLVVAWVNRWTFYPRSPEGGTMDLQMDFFFSFSFISFSTPPTLGVGWDCTVLYCVLYCIVLYCTVLYCIVLYCTVLYCIVLYCTVLYCIVLYCTVLYCTALYCTVLYCEKKKNPTPQKKIPPKKNHPHPHHGSCTADALLFNYVLAQINP